MKIVGLLKISGINLSPLLRYGENQNWNKPVGAYLHHKRPSESEPSLIGARGKISSLGKRRNDGEIQERGNYIANFEKKRQLIKWPYTWDLRISLRIRMTSTLQPERNHYGGFSENTEISQKIFNMP